MKKTNRTILKYLSATTLATSLAFTPFLSGGAFAFVDSKDVHANTSGGENGESGSQQTQASTILEYGDTGQAVKDLQSKLSDRGYYTYNLDGIFGPITEDAVKEFQADHGLKVDGLAGPKTLSALSSNTSTTSNKNGSSSDTSAVQSKIVSVAKSLVGTPYVWGGTTPSGFDSSGFINYVFSQVGVNLSRTENGMWENDGVKVDSPEVGDVVFFQGTYDTSGASHSGIYIGNNKIIHAGSNGVEISDLSIDYWQNHYLGVKSFI